jgi:hypothetical protein
MSSSRDIREQIGALVDPNLLKLLRHVFPLKHPKPGQPVDQMFFDAGHQGLIEYLSECARQVRSPS